MSTNLSSHLDTPKTQIERIFIMLRNKRGVDMWASIEKMKLKKARPGHVARAVFRSEKIERSCLRFLTLVSGGDKWMNLLIDEVHCRKLDSSSAATQAVDYVKTFGK